MTNKKIVLYIVLLGVVTLAAYIILVVIPSRLAANSYDGARRIAADIRNAFKFQPEITVNNTVILGQQNEVFELSLISQSFRHEYEWINTWMGSTKKINISGTFEAKAGFDLKEQFSIDVRKDRVIVTLPRARVLSVSPRHDMVSRDENGLWNWVNAEERMHAINAFTRNAEVTAQKGQYVVAAERELEQRLTEIFRQHGKEAVFVYNEPIQKN